MMVPFVSLPGRYAKALFEVGKEKNILSELSDNFKRFIAFIFQNKCMLTKHVKRGSVKDICKTIGDVLRLNTVFISFVNVLVGNGRLNIVKKIADIFDEAILKEQNERCVTVCVPFDLPNEQKHDIEKIIQKLFSEKTNVKYEIDVNILTGLIIKTDGMMIDASGKGIVRQLDKYLKSTRVL